MPMEMENPTFQTHPFSYSSSMSNESNEVKPMNGMEESISFGRFTSESLNWEKWSTFNSNRYVEEAEKYSKPGSVMQKKAFLEAHFKKMTSLKDEPSTTPSPDHDPDDSISIQQPPSEHLILSSEPTINDQQWIDKEDFGDKSSNEQVELSGIDAVGLDQLPDINPVAETVNGITNEQEFGSQRSSVNQENSAPESVKRTPLSSYLPAIEADSSLIPSTTQEDSGVQSPSSSAAAAHPVKEMKKRRSSLYKIINAKLIKKITGSSKPSENSRLKTSVKQKPKSKLFHICLCGSKPPSN